MSDDACDMPTGKFLHQVGVTPRQNVEAALRNAGAAGNLPGEIGWRVALTSHDIGINHSPEDRLWAGDAA